MNDTSTSQQDAWLKMLAGCSTDLFLLDLDGTVWGDILVVLNEQFGPVDPDGEKRWKKHDRAFKVDGTMTNGAHLEAEYRDLLEAKTIDEMIAWLKENHKLVPGVKDFLAFLRSMGVTPVAVSNGSLQIAVPMLKFHGVEMPIIANSLRFSDDGVFEAMEFVHNEDDGVRKGELAEIAAANGYRVIGCAGDSKGDVCMAEATAKLGGLVLACGDGGLTAWCEQNEGNIVSAGSWLTYDDFGQVTRAVQARLGGF